MFGSASMSTTLMRDPNTEAERAGLRPQVAARAPTSAKFQARTGRTLPIVVLTKHPSLGCASHPSHT